MAQILPYRQQQPIGAAKTYTTLGDGAFQVAAPKLLKNLPFILILEVHYFYHLLRKHLRTVPTIVIAHTFCASPDTRISYRQCLINSGIFLRGLKLSGECRS